VGLGLASTRTSKRKGNKLVSKVNEPIAGLKSFFLEKNVLKHTNGGALLEGLGLQVKENGLEVDLALGKVAGIGGGNGVGNGRGDQAADGKDAGELHCESELVLVGLSKEWMNSKE
jgi:hypothetical protein